MLKKSWKELMDRIQEADKKTMLLVVVILVFSALFLGTLIRFLLENLSASVEGSGWRFRWQLLAEPATWIIGVSIMVFLGVIYALNGGFSSSNKGARFLKGKGGEKDRIEGSLENSRFLTDEERDKYFPPFTYETLPDAKKDGVPVRAVLDKKGHLVGNFKPGVHALVIGATGSGKTTTFINPMIQLIGATNCGSSMIMTDPKGELFDLHSGFLKSRGYNVMVLDLRDTYSSSRWNPLEPIWDAYQEYLELGSGIVAHVDAMSDYPDLKRMDGDGKEDEPWIEWKGRAYLDAGHCKDDVSVERQKIYDAMYEDLSDLVSGLIPVQNEKDPLWEKGARSIVQATCLAMLEDSADPNLDMTKEKFNLFNVSKALTDNTNNYQNLKDYFEGRGKLSQAYQLSRQVLSAPEATLGSYMSITMDKLNLFNDRGLCGRTSATDIKVSKFVEEPTALFLKIPDEKDLYPQHLQGADQGGHGSAGSDPSPECLFHHGRVRQHAEDRQVRTDDHSRPFQKDLVQHGGPVLCPAYKRVRQGGRRYCHRQLRRQDVHRLQRHRYLQDVLRDVRQYDGPHLQYLQLPEQQGRRHQRVNQHPGSSADLPQRAAAAEQPGEHGQQHHRFLQLFPAENQIHPLLQVPVLSIRPDGSDRDPQQRLPGRRGVLRSVRAQREDSRQRQRVVGEKRSVSTG